MAVVLIVGLTLVYPAIRCDVPTEKRGALQLAEQALAGGERVHFRLLPW
jgi:hypothetical protein